MPVYATLYKDVPLSVNLCLCFLNDRSWFMLKTPTIVNPLQVLLVIHIWYTYMYVATVHVSHYLWKPVLMIKLPKLSLKMLLYSHLTSFIKNMAILASYLNI